MTSQFTDDIVVSITYLCTVSNRGEKTNGFLKLEICFFMVFMVFWFFRFNCLESQK